MSDNDDREELNRIAQDWVTFLVQTSADAQRLAERWIAAGDIELAEQGAKLAGVFLAQAKEHYAKLSGQKDMHPIDEMHRCFLRPTTN